MATDADATILERLPLAAGRPVQAYGGTLAICAAAFAVRWLAGDYLPGDYPYISFFPAIILSAFLFGPRAGVLAAVTAGLAAWYCFMPPAFAMKWSGAVVFALAFFAVVATLDITLITWLQRVNARLTAERERGAKLAIRSELLFRELQHRVSNNLQVVSGLLSLQLRDVSDPAARTAIQEAARRLGLIGRIHRQLYDPQGEQIDLGPFLTQLCAHLIDAGGKPGVVCMVDAVEDAELAPEAAVPVALILAEAVANAIEHGMADRETGHIAIRAARRDDGFLELKVVDDGRGLPDDFDLAGSDSLGLRLARMLADQIGGSFRLFVDGQTTALLRVPIR